jgi:AcrR family transcriptional regulator
MPNAFARSLALVNVVLSRASAAGASRRRTGGLYEAVLALVRGTGYQGLTLDAVAALAHVSKATLYRP